MNPTETSQLSSPVEELHSVTDSPQHDSSVISVNEFCSNIRDVINKFMSHHDINMNSSSSVIPSIFTSNNIILTLHILNQFIDTLEKRYRFHSIQMCSSRNFM